MGKKKNKKKEKTLQQQKGLPMLSADLNYTHMYIYLGLIPSRGNCFMEVHFYCILVTLFLCISHFPQFYHICIWCPWGLCGTPSTFVLLKAILRLFIYKALYDQSYLGSKATMTTGEWSCLISFAWDLLTCSKGRGGSEKFKMKIFVSSGIRTHASPRHD